MESNWNKINSNIENDKTTSELLFDEIIEEVKKMTIFENPNNFDEYFTKVLPRISKLLVELFF
jgi:hypothetical protein